MTRRPAIAAAPALLASSARAEGAAPGCTVEAVVLGAGQDAGAPQIGNRSDGGPRLLPSSLAVIDRENGKRHLFDATPAITEQMDLLESLDPERRAKVHFIYYNHTNPIPNSESSESRQVHDRGFAVARRGDHFCLD